MAINYLTEYDFKSQTDHKRGLASRPVMEHTARTGGNSPVTPPILAGAGQNTLSLPNSPDSNNSSSLCSILTIPPYMDERDHIVGYSKLRQLLRPGHLYFANKQAFITGASEYKHSESDKHSLLYVHARGENAYATKNNPYRKYQNSRAHSGRTVGQVRNFILNNQLSDFRMACPVWTMPDDMSRSLAERGKGGREVAWRVFKRFVNEDVPSILGIGGEMASLTNLHVWSSKDPLKPHYHFHQLIFNYSVNGADGAEVLVGKNGDVLEVNPEFVTYTKWFGKGILKQYRDPKTDILKVGPVPFSIDERVKLQIAWTKRLRDCCKRNHIKSAYLSNPDALVEIFIDFVSWDDGAGRPKFIHKVNYQKRSWVEDYCVFSNEHPGCDNPPAWLEGYDNRSRPLGYWCCLSSLGGVVGKESDRLSPFTAEKLIRVSNFSVSMSVIINRSGGDLGTLDISRGVVSETLLTDTDIEWLRSSSKSI